MSALNLNLPKIDTTDYLSGTAAEFEAKLNKSSTSFFIKDPGTYELRLDDIENRGIANDPNWIKLRFMFKTAKGGQYNEMLMLPIKRVNDFEYGAKKTLFPYRKVIEFLRAFGIVVEYNTAMSTIGTVLNNLEGLINKKIKVEIGYKGAYVKFLGKEGDDKQYVIVQQDKVLQDEDNQDLIFPDFKAAENYAAGVKLNIQSFPEILEFYAGEEASMVVETVEEDNGFDF